MTQAEELVERINDYLQKGGLFNPELMEHEKVNRLLMDCREVLRGRPCFVHFAGCPALIGKPVCTCPKNRFG